MDCFFCADEEFKVVTWAILVLLSTAKNILPMGLCNGVGLTRVCSILGLCVDLYRKSGSKLDKVGNQNHVNI